MHALVSKQLLRIYHQSQAASVLILQQLCPDACVNGMVVQAVTLTQYGQVQYAACCTGD